MESLHAWVDWALEGCKMVQNRQVGWMTLDRKTGQYLREQQPLLKKLKILLLFNPMTEWVDRTGLMRWWLHEQADRGYRRETSPKSKAQIQSFVDFYHINMDEFEPSDVSAFPTFQDFFIRKHKPSARPLYEPDDPTCAVISADSRVVVFDTVAETQTVWIKGRNFSIANLILDKVAARSWDNGAVASYRLSPQDYHRYHSPVTGVVKWWKDLDGQYYQVDPVALQSDVDILTANARCAFCLTSPDFGEVLFVAIGAAEVGTVQLSEKAMTPGALIEKGEEVGHFQFGGSSIIVAFENGRIEFDDDLRGTSKKCIMINVEVRMSLGRATKPAFEKW